MKVYYTQIAVWMGQEHGVNRAEMQVHFPGCRQICRCFVSVYLLHTNPE